MDYNGTDAGRHFWLRLPDGYSGPTPRKLAGGDGLTLDLLWAGRAVMMPPSTHRAGGLRSWLEQSPGAPPEATAWLLEAIAEYAGSARTARQGAECSTAGKHPVRSWKTDPESRPTTDPDKIAQWWSALGHLGAEVPEGWLERVPTRAIEGTSSGGVAL